MCILLITGTKIRAFLRIAKYIQRKIQRKSTDSMNDTVKQRLNYFIKSKNISINRFEKETGLSTGYVNNIRVSMQPDKIARIAQKFPELNTGWLLTGEGEMLKDTDDSAGRRHITAPADDSYRLVPMYNIDARGGFGTNDEVDGPQYIVDYIPFKDAKLDDICVSVVGNSMAPTYTSGSIVLLHRIEQWREFLELGQVYMVVLNDGRRLIKELRASQENRKENYLCVSHNPDFDPVELPKDMISHVFLVRAVYAKTSM